ncbi:50S ribosomal protein L6 [Serratia symbiotica]|nr:50S ribosomal protein L6 [Serratia symbiotica]
MSRIAKVPILIPDNVKVTISGQFVSIKGKNGELTRIIHNSVIIKHEINKLFFFPCKKFSNSWAQAGTTRALLNLMIIGVTKGFTKNLQLFGVGYRAIVKDNILNLSLGYSHIIKYQLPKGIIAECQNQTEIILKGADKQMIGQVAANLRAYRRPEPYKGKGIRYATEIVRIKEAKKK